MDIIKMWITDLSIIGSDSSLLPNRHHAPTCAIRIYLSNSNWLPGHYLILKWREDKLYFFVHAMVYTCFLSHDNYHDCFLVWWWISPEHWQKRVWYIQNALILESWNDSSDADWLRQVYSTKLIQVPYQVYTRFMNIQITIYPWHIMNNRHVGRPLLRSYLTAGIGATRKGKACTAMVKKRNATWC